jgi:hypothetical protein
MTEPCADQRRAAAERYAGKQMYCISHDEGHEGLTEAENPTGEDEKPLRSINLETPQGSDVERVAGCAER